MRLVSARQGPSRQFLASVSPTYSPLTFSHLRQHSVGSREARVTPLTGSHERSTMTRVRKTSCPEIRGLSKVPVYRVKFP